MNARTVWTRQLHQRGSGWTLAVAGGCVVLHERRTRLVRLDRETGTARWDTGVRSHPYDVVIAEVPAYGEELVLVQEHDRLLCLRLSSGAEVWSVELPRYCRAPVVAGGAVLTGGWRGYTPPAAFRLTDGRPLWRTPERAPTVRPLAWGGGVLLGHGGDVRLAAPRDGRTLATWRLPDALPAADHRPVFTALDQDRCLVRCGRRSLFRLRLSTGETEPFLCHDAELAPTAAEFAGGVVWVREASGPAGAAANRGSGAGRLLALSPDDGALLGLVETGEPLVDGVVPVPGGGCAVAGQNGAVYLVRRDGRIARRLGPGPLGRTLALRDLGEGALAVVGRGTVRAVDVTRA